MATSWALEERKLIPLYEDLHAGKYANATTAIDKWLQTRPRSQPALALKMALVEKARQPGYAAEVLGLWERVLATGWLTDRSVWLGTATLRSIDRPDLVVEMHRARWAARPRDASLGDPLFLAASTVGDHATMAATARTLFNQTKAAIWARMAAYSAYLQATSTTSSASSPSRASFDDGGAAATAAAAFPLCPEKSLAAASLFLRTLPPAPESADVLWLRLAVLIGAREFGAARELIRKEARGGALARRWAGMQAAAAIAAYDEPSRAAVWAEEFETTAACLKADREAQANYAFYRHAVDAVALGGVPAADARALFQDLQGTVRDRSPALALLELDARSETRMGDAEWRAALEGYLERWGGKWTALSEVTGVSAGREAVADQVMAARAQRFRAHASEREFVALCVAEQYALKRSPEGSAAEAARLWGVYEAGLGYGAALPRTDVQPADAVGLAAVEHLARVWRQEHDAGALQSAAVLLETILAHSPSSAPARLALVRAYRELGAPGLAGPHAAGLKLSEVQLDALGWAALERADDTRGTEAWGALAEKAAFMYARSRADLPQYITHALEHESYSKIRGIQTLVANLEHSAGQAALDAELVLRDLAHGGTPDPAALKRLRRFAESPLVDTRVYDLLPPSLASAQSTGDVQALCAAVLPLAAYVAGDEAALDAPPYPSADAPALAASLCALAQALQRAVKEDGEPLPLASVFAAPLTPAETATVVQVCDRLSAHLTAVLPSGKKKKNKSGQLRKARLHELNRGLKAVRELLPRRAEAAWEWKPTLGDEERRKELGAKVAAARAELQKAVQGVLAPRK